MSRKVSIKQLDYFTGELIETYNSLVECAYDNLMPVQTLEYALKHNNGFMKRKKLRFERC